MSYLIRGSITYYLMNNLLFKKIHSYKVLVIENQMLVNNDRNSIEKVIAVKNNVNKTIPESCIFKPL